MIKKLALTISVLSVIIITLMPGCQSDSATAESSKKSIVVTYSILGSVVKELVGDNANVTVLMPNGADLHGWEPSARDIETVNKADLVVQNGLELEIGLLKTVATAVERGVNVFTASDYITVLTVGEEEFEQEEEEHHSSHNPEAEAGGEHDGDHHHEAGTSDPHLWTDPLAMKRVSAALTNTLKTDLGIDVGLRSENMLIRFNNVNQEIEEMVSEIPAVDRKLVTGHKSMGYFAHRYGFKQIGAIIPSITSQAAVSAADLAALKELIEDNQVKAIFTEIGTSPAVAKSIGQETGVRVIELATHTLPADGSYFTFIRNLTRVIVNGLK
ncbi:MAG: zinc ABC transporter substrate-binding protein [Dehalococcoidia bacterium]|nr:zinc ABC transporter substrate-binding protein [Dehalococcoidia bacterium]